MDDSNNLLHSSDIPCRTHEIDGVTYFDVAVALQNENIKAFLEEAGHKFRKKGIPQELSNRYPGRLFARKTQFYKYEQLYSQARVQNPGNESSALTPHLHSHSSAAETSRVSDHGLPIAAAPTVDTLNQLRIVQLENEDSTDSRNAAQFLIHSSQESAAQTSTGVNISAADDNSGDYNHSPVPATAADGADVTLLIVDPDNCCVETSQTVTVSGKRRQQILETVESGDPGAIAKRVKPNEHSSERKRDAASSVITFSKIPWAKETVREGRDLFGYASSDEESSSDDDPFEVDRHPEAAGAYLNNTRQGLSASVISVSDVSLGTQRDVEVRGIIDALRNSNGRINSDGSFTQGEATVASIVRFAGQHLGIKQNTLTMLAQLFNAAAGEKHSIELGNLHSSGRQIIQQNRRPFELEAKKYK